MLQIVTMVKVGFSMLPLVVLFMFQVSTLQGCFEDAKFQQQMSKEGYSWCTSQQDLLYVKGFQRVRSTDDLRDFRKVKCCQPPTVHRGKPYTCTSADWDMSFSRFVSFSLCAVFLSFGFIVLNSLLWHPP